MKEVMDRYIVGGVVNHHRSVQECRDDRELRQGAMQLEKLKNDLYEMKVKLDKQNAVLKEEKSILQGMEARIHAKTDGQRERVRMAQKEYDLLEQKHDGIEIELHKNGLEAERLTQHFEQKEELTKTLAKKRARNEKKAAKQFLRVRRSQLEEIHMDDEKHLAMVDPKKEAARIEREKAKRRVAEKQKEKEALFAKIQEEYKHQHKTRAEEILKLKHATAASQAEIQGKNNKRAIQEAKIAAKEKAEFDQILEAGGNPYEVFRRRKQDAKIQAQKARIQKKLKQSEMALAQKMIAFDEYMRSKDEEEAQHKKYAEEYSKSLGRHLHEERVRTYMKSRTIGGVESIDPSGRAFRVNPSEVTVMKTHAFGLGKVQKSRGDIVDMIAAKPIYSDVEPDMKLVPRKLRPFVPQKPQESIPRTVSSAGSTRTGPRSNKQQHQNVGVDLIDLVSKDQLDLPPPGAQYFEPDSREEDSNVEDERNLVAMLKDGDEFSESAKQRILSQGTQKKYKLRELSTLEKQILAKARESHRRNIVQDQIVWGKKYEGHAFLPKPAVLHFKDFEVGKTYTKVFTLTNVSYTFNSFKLLDLPDEVKNFFTITYEKPGRMSAGVSCKLKIVFEPKVNEDIFVDLPFLANTGPFNVPIQCTIRTVKPGMSSELLDFGTVVIGEEKRLQLKLENDGALDCEYIIEPTFQMKDEDGRDIAVREDDFEIVQPSGLMRGYSSKFVEILYKPIRESYEHAKCNLVIKFLNEKYECAPLECMLVGQSSDVPIYTEVPELDFLCCAFDKLYRNVLVMRNRGGVALRVQVKPSKGFEDYLEILPDMGFVQARTDQGDGKFGFQLKFRPTEELLRKHGNIETGEIEIPVNITVPDQVLPVPFSIRAILTKSDIEFVPHEIDFGNCYINQSIQVPVQMKNLSRLPQKYGFVKLKNQLDVQPANGFGTLLPMDDGSCSVIFSPTAAMDYKFSLTCRTSLNRQFVIPIRGTGVEPPLSMSHTVITFGATGLGSRVRASTFMRNASKEPRTFHFQLPDEETYGHGLKISPLVGTIEPGKTIRVEVEFAAQKQKQTELEPPQSTNIEGESKEEENEQEVEGEVVSTPETKVLEVPSHIGKIVMSVEGEPWSKHCSWNIPCHVQGFELPMYVRVDTVTTEADIVADQEDVDFGQVAVAYPKTMVLRIRNFGKTTANLSCQGLNPLGPFSVVNAIRAIEPQGSQAILVKFCPQANRKYRETLTLVGKNCTLDIVLNGQGVSPVLHVDVQDGNAGSKHVDFGDVFVGEVAEKTISLSNDSVFGLDYAIETVQGSLPPTNFGGRDVFLLSPQEGHIDAGEKSTVKVTFGPDQELLQGHQGKFEVVVPNQAGEHILDFQGRCWQTPLFAYTSPVGAIASRDQVVDEFAFGKAMVDYTIRATFDDLPDSDTPLKLVIGSCTAKAGGSFEILDVPNTLIIKETKGVIKPDSKMSIDIGLVKDSPQRIGEHRLTLKLDNGNGNIRKVILLLRKHVD